MTIFATLAALPPHRWLALGVFFLGAAAYVALSVPIILRRISDGS